MGGRADTHVLVAANRLSAMLQEIADIELDWEAGDQGPYEDIRAMPLEFVDPFYFVPKTPPIITMLIK